MKSSFTEPDVAFIVEGEKIFTHRAELMKKSPVFNSMFSSNFMEKDKFEIELPGKNMHHFLMFLRCTLDGYGDDIEGNYQPKVHTCMQHLLVKRYILCIFLLVKVAGYNMLVNL